MQNIDTMRVVGSGAGSRRRLAVAFVVVLAATARPTAGAVQFAVSINDPGDANAAYHADVERVLLAAANGWAEHLAGDAVIDIEVVFEANGSALMFAGAEVAVFAGFEGGSEIYQWGTTSEILTGVDPNGAERDGLISVSPTLIDQLWFDPAPGSGSPDIPPALYDAYSVFQHELGHVLAFNGWLEYADPSLLPPGRPWEPIDEPPTPIMRARQILKCGNGLGCLRGKTVLDAGKSWLPTSGILSVFDGEVATGDDGAPGFDGSTATGLFGSSIPLDPESYTHVSIAGSLMHTYANPGVRDQITDMELSILADCGLPVLGMVSSCDGDADGDGLNDCVDPCPSAGEHVDGNFDGTLDCLLAPCPDDTDTDGDGYFDCVDGCPSEPTLSEPGLCGCEPCPDDDTEDEDETDEDEDEDDEEVLGDRPDLPVTGGAGCGVGLTGPTGLAMIVLGLMRGSTRGRRRRI